MKQIKVHRLQTTLTINRIYYVHFFYLAVCDEFPKHTAQNTLKEQYEKASGLKGRKSHAGYLHCYGLGHVLGMKVCHAV